MAEYIDKRAAIADLNETYDKMSGFHPQFYNGYQAAVNRIRVFQTAEVEPVRHGRWKYYRKQGIAVCTECSFERNLDENFGRAMACPNCGARMDGGADNG